MNKILLPILFLITLLSINAFAALQITALTPTSRTINFADTTPVQVDVRVTVSNTATTQVNTVLVKGELTDPTTNSITVNSQEILSLVNTNPQTVTLTFTVPRTTAPNTYTFNIVAADQDLVSPVASDTEVFRIAVAESPAIELLKGTSSLGNSQTGNKIQTTLTGERGDEGIQLQLKVKNIGNVALNSMTVSHSFLSEDLTDDDGDAISFSVTPGTISSIAVGSEATITLSANIDSGFDIGTVSKSLRLTSSALGTVEYPLKLDVRPLACSSSADNKLEITIVEPDDEQEFEPGDTINLRVDVENKADEKKSIKVEAGLYNVDRNKKLDSSSSTQSIPDGNEDTYLFEFALNTEDIDTDDEYVIYVKAYEKSEETSLCSQEDFDVEISIPEHKIVMESISLLPTTVSCGSAISGSVILTNVGENSETVFFTAENTELNLLYTSPTIRLDSIDEEDNSELHRFSLPVPFNTKEGEYTVNLKAIYGSESVEEQKPVTVSSCGTVVDTQRKTIDDQLDVTSGADFVDLTGAAIAEKSFFEKFNTGSYKVPTSVWVLADIALVLIILTALVVMLRRR